MFHQRNPPHRNVEIHDTRIYRKNQIKLKEVRNEIFDSDRYQFFNCKQEVNGALEKLQSRLKQKAALCNCEEIEDSLVKVYLFKACETPKYRWI